VAAEGRLPCAQARLRTHYSALPVVVQIVVVKIVARIGIAC
jgi:hypothetical protein